MGGSGRSGGIGSAMKKKKKNLTIAFDKSGDNKQTGLDLLSTKSCVDHDEYDSFEYSRRFSCFLQVIVLARRFSMSTFLLFLSRLRLLQTNTRNN